MSDAGYRLAYRGNKIDNRSHPGHRYGQTAQDRGGAPCDEVQSSRKKIAMVGDRLYTDVAFGKNCGFVSVLVLSGETTSDMLPSSKIKPDYVFDKVKDIVSMLK